MKNLFKLMLTLLVGVLASFAWGSGAVYAQDDDGDVDKISQHQVTELTFPMEVRIPYNRTSADDLAQLDYHAVMREEWRLWSIRKEVAIVSKTHTSKSKGFNPALDWPALQDC